MDIHRFLQEAKRVPVYRDILPAFGLFEDVLMLIECLAKVILRVVRTVKKEYPCPSRTFGRKSFSQ